MALEQTVRTTCRSIQVPPRGLWGRSGPVAHTSIEAWLGERPAGAPHDPRRDGPSLPRGVRAGERHGRPGVVRPDPAAARSSSGCGPTSRRSATSAVASCSTCPTAPRPDADTPAPPRFLYDFENLHLSYADRTRTPPPEVVAPASRSAPNETFSTFTLDGFVAGTWKVIRDRRAATLEITRLRPQTARGGARPGRGRGAALPVPGAGRRRPATSGSSIRERRTPSCNRGHVLPCERESCHNPATMTVIAVTCACSCRPSAMQGGWCIEACDPR